MHRLLKRSFFIGQFSYHEPCCKFNHDLSILLLHTSSISQQLSFKPFIQMNCQTKKVTLTPNSPREKFKRPSQNMVISSNSVFK